MDYQKIESEMRDGNFKNAKKLTRAQRVKMIDEIFWSGSSNRALEIARIFLSNFTVKHRIG